MPVLLSTDSDSSKITASAGKSYYHYVHPYYPLNPYTLPEIYERAAERDDGHGIIWHKPREFLTHKQLYIEAMKYAKGLLAVGLKNGDKLVAFGVRTSEATIMFMACSSIGVRFMQPYCFPVEDQGQIIIDELEPNMVFIGGCIIGMAVKESMYDGIASLLKKRENTSAHQVKHVYYDSEIEKSRVNPLGNSICQLKEAGNQVSDEDLRLAKSKVTRNHPTMYVFTTGTTGKPKMVLLGAAGLTNSGARKAERYGITKDTKMGAVNIFAIDLAHIEEVVGSIIIGHQLVIYPVPSEDAAECLRVHLEATSEHKPVLVHMDQWYTAYIINHPGALKGYDFTSVKGFLIATACTTVSFKQKLMQQYPLSYDCYGSMEFMYVASSRPGQNAKKPQTIGKPYANIEVKLVDENKNIVPIGCQGELYVRGYCAFLEYHDQVLKKSEVVDSEEWMRTGDMAVMDEDMDMQILGRAHGMERLKVLGDVVYVAPIEERLLKHPMIQEAMVVGKPLEGANGVEVCYCIVTKPGHELTVQQILDHADKEMEYGLQWPFRVFFVDKIPRHGSRNKVSRADALKEVLRRIELDPEAGWTGRFVKQT